MTPIPAYWLAAALVVGAEFMFASNGAVIRWMSSSVDNAVMVFFRNLFGLMLLLPWLLHGGLARLKTEKAGLHLLRGLSGLSAMYCFFYAIANLPLAEAMLLKLTSPLFIPVIAVLWLRERLHWQVVAALLGGFAGVYVILAPNLAAMATPMLVALLGGVFAAMAKVTMRRLGSTEPPERTVFYFALIGTLVSALPLPWSLPQTEFSPTIFMGLFAIGLLATIGQLLLTRGFARAPAVRVSPYGYFAVIFGGFWGWLFWDEILSWTTLVGSLMILAAGILALHSRKPAVPPQALADADLSVSTRNP